MSEREWERGGARAFPSFQGYLLDPSGPILPAPQELWSVNYFGLIDVCQSGLLCSVSSAARQRRFRTESSLLRDYYWRVRCF